MTATVFVLAPLNLWETCSSISLASAAKRSKKRSKKAQKKLARAARYQEVKLERRAKEKERKKEKKRLAREELARKREAGEPVSEDEQPRKRVKTNAEPFGARLVIDLGFDNWP